MAMATLRLVTLFVLVFGVVYLAGSTRPRHDAVIASSPLAPGEVPDTLADEALMAQAGSPPLRDADDPSFATDKVLIALDTGPVVWLVGGHGDPSYNGGYRRAGTHDGKPCYVGGRAGRYLYWQAGSEWQLGEELGGMMNAYGGEGEELPANPWHQGAAMGTMPAPEIEAVPDALTDATLMELADEELSDEPEGR